VVASRRRGRLVLAAQPAQGAGTGGSIMWWWLPRQCGHLQVIKNTEVALENIFLDGVSKKITPLNHLITFKIILLIQYLYD